ncbi:lipopolysaccharide biosynthesis protein, partial [Photobacterium minamisatsumaniensis]|uniref:lipopolysaccharide biosynthesis protein n=1 Tax=Photobacterium minamisatsumaniensis TaxID=2910233 RepID=UPI003D1531E9
TLYYDVNVNIDIILSIGIGMLFYNYSIERSKNHHYIKIYERIFLIQPILCIAFVLFVVLYKDTITVTDVIYVFVLSNILSSLLWIFRRNELSVSVNSDGLIKTSFYIWLNSIVSFFANNIDKLIIYKMLSMKETGIYVTMFSLASLVSKIFERISVNLLSYFQKNDVVASKYLTYSFGFIFLSLPTCYVFSFYFGDFIITSLFGEKYSGNEVLLSNIIAGSLIASLSWMLAQKLISDLKIYTNLIRTIGSVVVFLLGVGMLYYTNNVNLYNISICYILSCVYRFLTTVLFLVYYEKP